MLAAELAPLFWNSGMYRYDACLGHPDGRIRYHASRRWSVDEGAASHRDKPDMTQTRDFIKFLSIVGILYIGRRQMPASSRPVATDDTAKASSPPLPCWHEINLHSTRCRGS